MLALLLNEVYHRKFLKVVQSTYLFPNFLSWVIVSYILYALLSSDNGLVNNILISMGKEPVRWYAKADVWPAILTVISVWKGVGICHGVIETEEIISRRIYHTITEAKNGAGAVPIKGKKYWIHIAHGVRNTAAGLRYVLYAFATDLKNPQKVVAEPSGIFLVPIGKERVGDVSNVVFTNGAIARENRDVFIYYASCDTRMHVATTTVDKLEDYLFQTPKDPLRSTDCVKQRCSLIKKNLEVLNQERVKKQSELR